MANLNLMITASLVIAMVTITLGTKVVDPLTYLHRYGYLNPGRSSSNDLDSAVKKFQAFAHLPTTGLLDSSTLKQMTKRRCGVKDSGHALISIWKKYALTYKITKYTNDMSRGDIDRVIASAYKIWSDVTPLTFTQVHPSAPADMDLRFDVTNHGDNYPFDGPNGVLAHAFYPSSGEIHFDDEEKFSEKFDSYTDINLYFVAAHEIGHSLGLEHSMANGALMNPFHWTKKGAFKLPADDVQRIQQAYGDENTIPTAFVPTTVPCVDKDPNCAARVRNGDCSRHYNAMMNWCYKSCNFC